MVWVISACYIINVSRPCTCVACGSKTRSNMAMRSRSATIWTVVSSLLAKERSWSLLSFLQRRKRSYLSCSPRSILYSSVRQWLPRLLQTFRCTFRCCRRRPCLNSQPMGTRPRQAPHLSRRLRRSQRHGRRDLHPFTFLIPSPSLSITPASHAGISRPLCPLAPYLIGVLGLNILPLLRLLFKYLPHTLHFFTKIICVYEKKVLPLHREPAPGMSA